MEIRSDFASAKIYLERLLLFGDVFHENNIKNWSHLKNREDFKNIFMFDDEVRYKFEKVYSVGRDLAVYMSRQLDTFNDPAEHPTLTSYIKSFDNSWLAQIDQLQEISQVAKEEKRKLEYSCPWAVEQMIILFDKQINLLQDVTDTLSIIKTTDIYKIESSGRVIEKTQNRPLKIFLCHTSGDKPAVRTLYTWLRDEKIDVWLDEENLLPGQDWQTEIPKAVQSSDAIIICISNKSITKEGYIQKEIKFALDIADEKPEGTIFIIPCRLEECNVPARLSRWQYVDLFFDNGFFTKGHEKLLKALHERAQQLRIVSPKAMRPKQVIDINTSSEEEFKSLPGIGSVLAKQIIKYRSSNGPFKSIDELLQVPGISVKSIEKIKDKVTY